MAPQIRLKTLYYSVGVSRWACSRGLARTNAHEKRPLHQSGL